MAKNSTLVDLEMVIHVKTERAVLASDTGDKEDAVWLPLSQIEIDGETITMPEWLAEEKGLI